MKKPELLIPAGNLEKLKVACIYGADAVFLGGQEYGLRSNSDNFSYEDIKEGCEFARRYDVDVYVTTNIYAHSENFHNIDQFFIHLQNCGVKGIIVSDPGYIEIAKKVAPQLEIHISTQQSITNYECVKFWEDFGVDRVVLARELNFDEIREIRKKTKTEIEIFIHGAVCSSYSGRCTLSNHMTSRDSNRGGCCQSCRWDYQLYYNDNNQLTKVDVNNEDILFNMSCKDMNTLEYLPQIIELNVDSLKVEGRMKTFHYVATVTKVYRQAIDAYFANPQAFKIKQEWIDELKKAESRLAYIGSFISDFSENDQIYQEQYQKSTGFDFVGMTIDQDDQYLYIEQRNLFVVGDKIEILSPHDENYQFVIEEMYDQEGNKITKANHPLMIVKLKIDKKIEPYSMFRKVVDYDN